MTIKYICDKVCQWLGTCRWFYPGIPVSTPNKTYPHDITKIVLKVALITINRPTINVQSNLVVPNSKGPLENTRVIRCSTYERSTMTSAVLLIKVQMCVSIMFENTHNRTTCSTMQNYTRPYRPISENLFIKMIVLCLKQPGS
jgi:hypothetical protein